MPDSGSSQHPETVDEVVDVMLEEIPDEDREDLLNMNQEDLFELHFTMGMSIRNRFVYPGGNALMKSVSEQKYGELSESPNGSFYPLVHEDDVSDLIIGALWERLHQGGCGA